MSTKPSRSCVNCHFFIREYRSAGQQNHPMVMNISDAFRERARMGDYKWRKGDYAMACFFGVWDEGYSFNRENQHEILVDTDRGESCFFWPYNAHMMLPAAKILQERSSNLRETWRDRMLTVVGLWIAGVALSLDVFLKVAELRKWWPYK